ncbi:MAG: cytidine deaminase [Lachnospiraceae bacterium]|nr:cytidine deaminase [Lachnospiraceae bacterium]
MEKLDDKTIRMLITAAIHARKMSYSPYSHYQVGAALLSGDGQVITGCNIENAAYTPTNCAERTAFFKAVSEGYKDFRAIAIVGSPEGDVLTQYAYPCGVCRQVMMEFCKPSDFQIIVAKSEDDYLVKTLQELLPEGFGPDNLNSYNNFTER